MRGARLPGGNGVRGNEKNQNLWHLPLTDACGALCYKLAFATPPPASTRCHESLPLLNRTTRPDALAPADYREAMSRLAGAVSIVTTDGAAGMRGVTVSAVVSVSDDPATLMVCLNRNRTENLIFEQNGCLALNVLCFDQLQLARAFAGEGDLSMQQRFALAAWAPLRTGAPLLAGARMALDGVVVDVQSVHTHYVIAVEAVASAPFRDAAALVYRDRGYHPA